MSFVKVMVSGGASGLGYAVAQHFCRQGCTVSILDQDEERGRIAKKNLGQMARFFPVDITDNLQIEKTVDTVLDQQGLIELLVNCAGVAPSERVLAKDGLMSFEHFERVIQINLNGSFNLCRLIANAMQNNEPNEQGQRGVIINTASIAAFDGQVGQAAYSASKGGIVSMTLPLARELARFGIRVNCIAPGLFATPMFEKLPQKAVSALVDTIPFPKRAGQPEEFAQLVEHIYNNTMINGETIRLDGALRM